jgi:hypothetical protein
VIRRLYEYINQNRADEFANVVALDYADHSNNSKGPFGICRGGGPIASGVRRSAYRDHRRRHEGDLVAIRWVETGRHVGQFFNLKPTAKPFESRASPCTAYETARLSSPGGHRSGTIRAQQAAQVSPEALPTAAQRVSRP